MTRSFKAVAPVVVAEVSRAGFKKTLESAHSIEFERKIGEFAYLKRTQKISIVLDPRFYSEGDVVNGSRGYLYWNSNLHRFDRRLRGGNNPEKHGVAFDVGTAGELHDLLVATKRTP